MKYDPNKIGSRLKSTLEKYKVLQRFLLVLALVGACMVIGDGILTPALSGLGKLAGSGFPTVNRFDVWITKDVELPVACVILICLFALQHYGTNRVGFLFAPVVITCLLCISSIGLYIIIHWNSHIYKALSPHYMYVFLKKAQGGGWMDLIFGNGLSLSEGALTVQGINNLLEDTCFSYLKCKVIGAGAQSFTGQRYSNDEQRTLGALDKNHRSYFLC